MRLFIATAAILLAGCATPEEKFGAAWPRLKGQPISALVDRWGPAERVVPPDIAKAVHNYDGPVYVWNSKMSAIWNNQTVSTGTIGTIPVTITTTTPESETYYCNVRVMTTRDNRIDRLTFTGSRGPCQQFADRL